ncbi:cutinase family protein [Mycolicibacterium sp. S2-37]|uniref:cutinase family protein n=1 Tax=Mycolicibacterium sp. S2-37 TaxID=2810297 RepID=UPI001A942403|nr:cutinase family protein [Mycolicibacterium sp. S2-37]MBO0681140.1 cutinase family protein [Mycolicibacterium sp. S2-37]
MTARRFARYAAAAFFAAGSTVAGVTAPVAAAQPAPPCADVEVVFARGTGEAPGVGGTGQSFVDALRAQAGARSINVYGVNYPAANNFDQRTEFARTVVDGIRDAGTRIQNTAAACPDTDIVLGGFSQGAIVAAFTTSATVPDAVPADYRSYIPQPLAPEIADHVAAVTLFGLPSQAFLDTFDAPAPVIGPAYQPKTIELCTEGDTICNGAPGGQPSIAHALYGVNGQTQQAAAFTVQRLKP